MKTPRDLLLSRHRDAEPALDQLRSHALRTIASKSDTVMSQHTRKDVRTGETLLGESWRELFVACRRYWTGLGAAWCVIIGFAVVGSTEESASAGSGTTYEQTVQALLEQQQLRDELLGPELVREARASRREPVPGPRSARHFDWVAV